MSKAFTPTPHPVLAMPTPAEAMAMGAERWRAAMLRREEIIQKEKLDPFRHSWEPPIWKVCDALLGFPWVDAEWAEKMRRRLGFKKRVRVLLINGGNRAGKSQYAGSRAMRILRLKDSVRGWALHSKDQMGIDYQQPIFWHYMDPSLKVKDIRSATTYITYKQKTGFSEGKFVLPNRSDMTFLNYEMDKKTIEGGNLDIIWPDELVPPDWVETMELRIAEKDGSMIVTFTPIEGYTPTVAMFQDGATVAMEMTAFVCPKDGGPPDVARALGLNEEQLEEIKRAAEEKRTPIYPQSVPQDCSAWIEGKTGQPDVPAGREFETVPRVLKCVDAEENRAVVFFHSADNPYGNPKSVWALIQSKPAAFIKERFYGVASKSFAARFPKFNLKVHVVSPEQVPAEGTNYHLVDPSSGRNFFMLWMRVTPENVYVYREWPGPYYIEGVGVPGPWALPDGRHPDGKPGPAQTTFGFGNLDYKKQIAKLEGWKDAEKPKPEKLTEREWIAEWDEYNGAREVIARRKMDSRFASAPKQENDRPVTLIDFL
jgi:phage terminase large subunit-like protein